MKSKDLLIVLLLAAGGLWFGFNKKGKTIILQHPTSINSTELKHCKVRYRLKQPNAIKTSTVTSPS